MTQKELIVGLDTVEKIATASKLQRMLFNPYKYLHAIFYRQFVYPKNNIEKIVDTQLFYGKTMRIALPAATDIYLTGGKSHASEIRLARFLILNLSEGAHFLDIGAHYGYFTMLAAELTGSSGRVVAFEAATKTFRLLAENTKQLPNTSIFNKAVSDTDEPLVFYEFPNLYSEYNSSDVAQFEQEDWFKNAQPVKHIVEATTVDAITAGDFRPQIIKIDVEGAEQHVIQAGLHYFAHNAPTVVMEYLEPGRSNESHKKALEILRGIGYDVYIITKDGSLRAVADIDGYLQSEKLESDNVVFKKSRA